MVPNVENYLYNLLRKRDEVLERLEKDAEKNNVPIVGPLVGNLLALIAKAAKARQVLEIGTATGYSGIWLGRVAKENGGKLTTIENDPERRKIAEKSFRDAGIADSVELRFGDASKLVPEIAREAPGRFDLVFLDVGAKEMYVQLFRPCVESLRVGGFLVGDNTLWNGYVADRKMNDARTRAVREFNELVYSDIRFHPVIIPLRDGVTVALKTSK